MKTSLEFKFRQKYSIPFFSPFNCCNIVVMPSAIKMMHVHIVYTPSLKGMQSLIPTYVNYVCRHLLIHFSSHWL